MSDLYIPAVISGTAIGDALGMPFESYGCEIHPALKAWKGDFERGSCRAGRWTDDTEMTIALATSMITEKRYIGRAVAANYHEWINGNPTGTGSTTRSALRKFDVFAEGPGMWKESGMTFDDPEAVGSGTAMRAAPIGVMYHDMPEMLRRVAKADAFITHRDQEAYAASLAVAAMVAFIVRFQNNNYNSRFDNLEWRYAADFLTKQLMVVSDTLTAKAIGRAIDGAKSGHLPEEFADNVAGRFGCAWQCTSTAIFCAFRGWHDFESGVQMAVRLGGDTDTRAAITGAILGAKFGVARIPPHLHMQVYKANELANMDKALFESRIDRGHVAKTDLG